MKIISVCSFKGGTGKTSIALNLAKISGIYQIKTLLWELNKNPGSLSSILNLDLNKNVFTAIMNPKRLPYCVHRVKDEYFDVLLGPPDAVIGEEIGDIGKLNEVLYNAKMLYDLIILDHGPYMEVLSIQLLNESDYILFILEPDVSCISNLNTNLSLIKERADVDLSDKIKIVLNKYDVFDNINKSQIKDVLGYEVFEKIKYDNTYRAKINRLASSIPKSSVLKGCEKIFKKLFPEAKKPKKERGLFKIIKIKKKK